MAIVRHIYLRPSARTPVHEVHEVEAVAGRGLTGDHAGGGKRQVTLLDLDDWRAACRALDLDLEPGLRRANLIVEGLALAGNHGRLVRVGEASIELVGELAPCKLMDDAAPGLMRALQPNRRGGAYGRVIAGGRIRVGDCVDLVEGPNTGGATFAGAPGGTRMKEIVPGIRHWTAMHPRIGIEVSSYYLVAAAALVDPLLPPEGLDALVGRPRNVFLTNRHHWRDSARFVERFGCTVWCADSGLHEFGEDQPVRGFRFGETLPGGIEAIEIGAICPDETALYAPALRAVALADGVIRDGDGPLRFVSDDYIGDDPPAVQAGLKRAYRRLLERDFDHLLLAHGHPWIGNGKQALARFVED